LLLLLLIPTDLTLKRLKKWLGKNGFSLSPAQRAGNITKTRFVGGFFIIFKKYCS